MICREVMVNKCSGPLAVAAYVIELSKSKIDATLPLLCLKEGICVLDAVNEYCKSI